HLHLVGVDDDDIVAHVHVRGESRLVLATQAHGDDRGEEAQNNALGDDQDPLLLDLRRFRGIGFHLSVPLGATIRDGGISAKLARRSSEMVLNLYRSFIWL